MLNIPVILGSVREGRRSEVVTKFVHEKVKAAGHESMLVRTVTPYTLIEQSV